MRNKVIMHSPGPRNSPAHGATSSNERSRCCGWAACYCDTQAGTATATIYRAPSATRRPNPGVWVPALRCASPSACCATPGNQY